MQIDIKYPLWYKSDKAMDIYGKVISYKCIKEGTDWVRYFTLRNDKNILIDCRTTLYLPLIESDVVLLPNGTSKGYGNVYDIIEHPYVLMDPGDDLVTHYFNRALNKPGLKKDLLTFYEYLTSYGSSKPNDIVNRVEDLIMMSDRGTPIETDFKPEFLDAILTWFRKNVCIRRFNLLNLTKDEVKTLFNSYDIPPYELYSRVYDNPYMLYPIGVSGCNKAFKVLRFSPSEQERLMGEAMIVLYSFVGTKGWTCINDINIPEIIMKNKDYYTKKYDLVWFHNYVYFPITYKVEMGLRDWFKERIATSTVEEDIVKRILGNSLTVVVGEAGTGKTTLISKVIEAVLDLGLTFHVCSFTGKAVQRAMQVLENKGILTPELCSSFSTIHRLILDKREFDYLIIDEVSMVSMPLFYMLKEYIPKTSKVLFVGDPNQLEPIEWGHMLECIINTKSLKNNIVRLTTVFRQKEGSGLMNNIRAVIDNKPLQNDENFQLCQCNNANIDDMVRGILEFEHGSSPESNVMVLSPYIFKLKYINDIARNIILDPGHTMIMDKWGNSFAVGDRVMLTSNNLNEGGNGVLYNGDEGIVTDLLGKVMVKWHRTGDVIGYDPTNDYEDEEMSISIFGTGKSRKTNSTKVLQVCYGITCHKSQGSEWDTIIFVNPWKKDSSEFVNKRLIYTSLSRAKNKCYVVGDIKGINIAIRRTGNYSMTLLPYHIDT
jgi:hypothetical protein